MSSRPSRPRAAVNYNEKEGSFQPAWLKSQQVQSTEDPSSSDGTKKTSSGKRRTAEKENAKQTQNSKKQASKAAAKKQNLVDSSSPEKEAEPAHKSKKEKVPAVAERGRNAGLVVVPIADHKTGRKKSNRQQPIEEPNDEIDLISPPSAPKEVPGLPGVVRKGAEKPAPPSKKSTGGSSKRKTTEATPASIPQKQNTTKQTKQKTGKRPLVNSDDEQSDEEDAANQKQQQFSYEPAQPPKRSRHQPPAAPVASILASPPPRAAARPARSTRAAAPATHVSSPELQIPQLPGLELADQYASLSALTRQQQELLQQKDQEIEELKRTRVEEQLQALLEQQNADVTHHGQVAAELAQHWKDEAERRMALSDRAQELHNETQKLKTDLATAQQAVLDLQIEVEQKNKRLVELEKRNVHLERYARVYETADKCVGTTGPHTTSAQIQAPDTSGLAMLEARAMAPEGATGSFVYHGDVIDAMKADGAMQQTYTLAQQRTLRGGGVRGGASGSDMHLVSSGPAGGHRGADGFRAPAPRQPSHRGQVNHNNGSPEFNFPRPSAMNGRRASTSLTAESNMHQSNNRRISAPPGMLMQHGGRTNQGMGLSAVAEGEEGEFSHGQQRTATSSGQLAPREQALHALTGFVATPMRGHRFMYTHQATGYQFHIGPAALDTDPEEDPEGDDFEMQYVPINFGSARDALARADIGEFLTDPTGFSFKQDQTERLLKSIMESLVQAK